MTTQGWLATGALLGGAAVALGAFGAHGLKARVPADLLAVFETAARYHLIHALAIVAVAWAAERFPGTCVTAAGWLFLGGILLFSGSLYALVLTGVRGLGAITPLGGLALIAGWILLAVAPFVGTGRR
jgi:uncharacterized membrane protein YgdD (TMEM256/DUF423 family)